MPITQVSTKKLCNPWGITECWWCPEQDSNLHASRHAHLKRTRLPFRHLGKKKEVFGNLYPYYKSGKRDSNSRPQPWQGCALPTELFPHLQFPAALVRLTYLVKERRLELPRLAALPPQSSASTNSATPPGLFVNLVEHCPDCDCKGTTYFRICKHLARKFSIFPQKSVIRHHFGHLHLI